MNLALLFVALVGLFACLFVPFPLPGSWLYPPPGPFRRVRRALALASVAVWRFLR